MGKPNEIQKTNRPRTILKPGSWQKTLGEAFKGQTYSKALDAISGRKFFRDSYRTYRFNPFVIRPANITGYKLAKPRFLSGKLLKGAGKLLGSKIFSVVSDVTLNPSEVMSHAEERRGLQKSRAYLTDLERWVKQGFISQDMYEKAIDIRGTPAGFRLRFKRPRPPFSNIANQIRVNLPQPRKSTKRKLQPLNRIKGLPKIKGGLVLGPNIGDIFKSKYMDKIRKYVPPLRAHKPSFPPLRTRKLSYSFLDQVKVADWRLQFMPKTITPKRRTYDPSTSTTDRLRGIEKRAEVRLAEERRMRTLLNKFESSITRPLSRTLTTGRTFPYGGAGQYVRQNPIRSVRRPLVNPNRTRPMIRPPMMRPPMFR